MKRTLYYEDSNAHLYTEREVKIMLINKKTLRKRVLSRSEICRSGSSGVRFPKALFDYDESIGELSTKDLKKRNVRRDMMRLGLVW